MATLRLEGDPARHSLFVNRNPLILHSYRIKPTFPTTNPEYWFLPESEIWRQHSSCSFTQNRKGNMSSESRKTLIKRREVLARTTLANSTLYELMRAGKFPQSVQIGPRSVAWIEEEVDAWIESRIEAARGKAVA